MFCCEAIPILIKRYEETCPSETSINRGSKRVPVFLSRRRAGRSKLHCDRRTLS
jgi:hypothetical protein